MSVQALFVDPRGPYPSLLGADNCWDIDRDARKYAGPWPVVAHPPCERWGRYWSGGPSARVRKTLGDDGGCFFIALAAVRAYGGVLEHPEASHAFRLHRLRRPSWRKGWEPAGDGVGRVCCVAQGNYGHRARKLTWLYAVANELPDLDWSIPAPRSRLDYGFHSKEERARRAQEVAPRINATRLTTAENLATPPRFAKVLVEIAKAA